MPDPVLDDLLEGMIAANSRESRLPWPLTVMAARYGGSYEDGAWVAFNCHPHEISADAYDDDCTCSGFWCTGQPDVGRGASPNEAIADLIKRLERAA